MKTFAYFVFFALAVLLVVYVLNRAKQAQNNTLAIPLPVYPEFHAIGPLTSVETMFYARLTQALPEYTVLAQVALNRLVDVHCANRSIRATWINKIKGKSIDYLICTKDLIPIAAIELDDSSHERADRQAKDADKDAALQGAGYKIIRWPVSPFPDTALIRKTVQS